MINLLLAKSATISYILYILLAICVLLVMITVHEFGHYIAGKKLGFSIEEFSIGFGPKLFSKVKKNGEIFSIRVLPLGGYCAFKGEDEESEDKGAFNNRKPWQRVIVLIAGAFMNYLLAIVLIFIMYFSYGVPVLSPYKTIENNEYGIEYSLNVGDSILKANGKNVYLITDLMNAVNGKKQGDEVIFTVVRDGEITDINVKLLTDTDFKNVEDIQGLTASLGVIPSFDENGTIVSSGFYSRGIRLGVFRTIGKSFDYSFRLAGTVFKVLGQLLSGALGVSSLGGTITTISVTAETIKINGFWGLLNIASFIGVNLAVFNLLPIPALDGARVVFTVIEWIRKKPIDRKIEGVIHTIGFILILIFAVFVDLQRCF